MRKNSFAISLLILMICSLFIAFAPQQSNAQTGTQVGGILWDNTTWTKAGSPYSVTSTIQIPANSSLTIEPGVTVTYSGVANQYDYSQSMFLVQGTIIAQGTENDKITFNGGGSTTFFKNGANSPFNWVTQEHFDFSHCTFQNVIRIFNLGSGSSFLNFRNCEVRNIERCSILYQVESENYIENNIFINSGGFQIWDWIESSFSPLTYHIQHNLVKGATDYFINVACNNQNTKIFANYNSFIDSAHDVLRLGYTMDGIGEGKYIGLDAKNNFWGTTDTATINSMIIDINDDMTSPGAISFTPILTVPDANTPTCITATAMTGGTITPNGILAATYGSSQTFTITANTGYHVADVLINNSSVGAVTSYNMANIQGATTISATFAADPTPTPTVNPTTNPTQQPTSTPTQTQSTEPSPTPTVPEFPALIAVTMLIAITMLAVITKRAEQTRK